MTAVVENEKETDPPSGTRKRPSAGRVVLALTAVAAVAAVTFGTLWVVTLTDGSRRLAEERDVVLAAAQQSAISLNTLDYRSADAGIDQWEKASTGSVLDEFHSNRDQYAKLVTDAKRSTQATATDAAVSELDDRSGVARVLVGVDVTVTPDGQAPVMTRQRLQLEMTRTPDGWKVSKLSPIRTPGTTEQG
jgi:Mce-associated membrane protein